MVSTKKDPVSGQIVITMAYTEGPNDVIVYDRQPDGMMMLNKAASTGCEGFPEHGTEEQILEFAKKLQRQSGIILIITLVIAVIVIIAWLLGKF